jgi:hypothetical protein
MKDFEQDKIEMEEKRKQKGAKMKKNMEDIIKQ